MGRTRWGVGSLVGSERGPEDAPHPDSHTRASAHTRTHELTIHASNFARAQSAASFIAYAATLGVSQGVGSLLRVSCASPLGIGTLGGVAGVGAASMAAGEAAEICDMVMKDVRLGRKLNGSLWLGKRKNVLDATLDGAKVWGASLVKVVDGRYVKRLSQYRPPSDTHAKQLLVDVLLGTVAFKLTGGSFRTLMPSDLIKPGALANQSIPAAGMQYATDEKRRELIRMFRRDGCHHCGKTRGPVVGDHMPPNKHVVQKAEALATQLVERMTRVGAVRRAMLVAGVRPDAVIVPRQRYYPQCVSCSQKQSVAVRNDRGARVFHTVLHKGGAKHGGRTGWWYVGTWVGLNRAEAAR